jgi:hypothetical protein
MDVCYDCYVLSGRDLCDGLIIGLEESYRLWCVVVCDLETSKNEKAMVRVGSRRHRKKYNKLIQPVEFYGTKIEEGQCMYKRNIEARSRYHSCRGDAIIIIYSRDLIIQLCIRIQKIFVEWITGYLKKVYL